MVVLFITTSLSCAFDKFMAKFFISQSLVLGLSMEVKEPLADIDAGVMFLMSLSGAFSIVGDLLIRPGSTS